MNWLHSLLAISATVAVIIGSGAPAAVALRARGFSFWFVTVPAAFAVLSVAPFVAHFASVPWGPLPVLLTALATAVLLALLYPLQLRSSVMRQYQSLQNNRGGAHKHAKQPWSAHIPAPVKHLCITLLCGSFAVLFMLSAMRTPAAVSQTYDANFHYNLVDYFLTRGSAYPLDIDLLNPGTKTFYPAAWHAIVALIVQLTGTSIPIATNAVMFVVVGVVWPLGAVAVSRALFGATTRITLFAAITAVVLPNMPYIPASYGVLLPFLLALALFNYTLPGVLRLLSLQHRAADPFSKVNAVTLTLGALGAATLAHPSALFMFAPVLTILLITAALQARKTRHTARLVTLTLLAVCGILSIGVLWRLGKTSDNVWPARQNPLLGTLEALSGAPHLVAESWLLGGVILLGAVLTLKLRKYRFLSLIYIGCVFLYVVADTFPWQELRTMFTGPWYNDSWRLATLLNMAAAPLLVLALKYLTALSRVAFRSVTRMFKNGSHTPTSGAATLTLLSLLLAFSPGMQLVHDIVGKEKYNSDNSMLLSKDEIKTFEFIKQHTTPGEIVLNSPWNGGALLNTYTPQNALFPHPGGNYPEAYFEMISGIPNGEPQACQTAKALGINYILDFGHKLIFKEGPVEFEPIMDIREEPHRALKLVYRAGDARVYKITGCG